MSDCARPSVESQPTRMPDISLSCESVLHGARGTGAAEWAVWLILPCCWTELTMRLMCVGCLSERTTHGKTQRCYLCGASVESPPRVKRVARLLTKRLAQTRQSR